jgi:hypothetical protein
MSTGLSGLATALLAVAVISLMPGPSWAIYYGLGPSKDDWGMKYDIEVLVNDASSDMVTVVFNVADQGRLKPFDLIELIAFNKETDEQGGHSYDVKAPIVLKPTKDGRLAGQVQMPKEFLDRAQIRILTRTFDGKPQSGLSYYQIPIKKLLNKTPAAAPLASPPAAKVTK